MKEKEWKCPVCGEKYKIPLRSQGMKECCLMESLAATALDFSIDETNRLVNEEWE